MLSTAYKQTSPGNMCDSRRYLCLTNGIHIPGGCLLSDGREIYNVATSGNLKYIYSLISLNFLPKTILQTTIHSIPTLTK